MRPLCDEKQDAFLRSYASGHTYQQIADAMAERWGEKFTRRKVKEYMRYRGIKTGMRGRNPNITHPVGTEVELRHGKDDGKVYVHVKTESGWRLKSHVVYEKANSQPVPDGCQIVHADRNTRNFSPENLVAVPISLMASINRMRLRYYDRESLETCCNIAKVSQAVSAKASKK